VDPIEGFVFTGLKPEKTSPWRSAGTAPKDEKPFCAINRGTADAQEFATAVQWRKEQAVFVDSGLYGFPFTDWMPIPPL
jgi:hypothetical protein